MNPIPRKIRKEPERADQAFGLLAGLIIFLLCAYGLYRVGLKPWASVFGVEDAILFAFVGYLVVAGFAVWMGIILATRMIPSRSRLQHRLKAGDAKGLAKLLINAQGATLREMTERALQQLGSKAIGVAQELLENSDELVRLSAIRVISKIDDECFISPLKLHLVERSSAVRQLATETLCARGWKPAGMEEELALAIGKGDISEAVKKGAIVKVYISVNPSGHPLEVFRDSMSAAGMLREMLPPGWLGKEEEAEIVVSLTASATLAGFYSDSLGSAGYNVGCSIRIKSRRTNQYIAIADFGGSAPDRSILYTGRKRIVTGGFPFNNLRVFLKNHLIDILLDKYGPSIELPAESRPTAASLENESANPSPLTSHTSRSRRMVSILVNLMSGSLTLDLILLFIVLFIAPGLVISRLTNPAEKGWALSDTGMLLGLVVFVFLLFVLGMVYSIISQKKKRGPSLKERYTSFAKHASTLSIFLIIAWAVASVAVAILSLYLLIHQLSAA